MIYQSNIEVSGQTMVLPSHKRGLGKGSFIFDVILIVKGVNPGGFVNNQQGHGHPV